MNLVRKLNTFLNNQRFNSDLINELKKQHIEAKKNGKNWQFFFPEEVFIRPSPSSDFSVFLQVFYHQQYEQLIDLVKLNQLEIKYIIDLGANVGYTSIYFDQQFQQPTIYSLEPDAANFQHLVKNTLLFENINPMNSAIWGANTYLEPVSNNAEDWGKSFKIGNNDTDKIKAITLKELMNDLTIEVIDILKMDIEGAEDEIFKSDISFLDFTKIVAIEIHDDLTERKMIYHALLNKGFTIWNFSEITIGINRKYL